jgi:hypothetical protein
MKDLVHKNRVTILEIVAHFCAQNHWTFGQQNRGTPAKS